MNQATTLAPPRITPADAIRLLESPCHTLTRLQSIEIAELIRYLAAHAGERSAA